MSRSWLLLVAALWILGEDAALSQPSGGSTSLRQQALGVGARSQQARMPELCKMNFDSAKMLSNSQGDHAGAISLYRIVYRTPECYNGIPTTAHALIGISKAYYNQGNTQMAMVYYYWYLDILIKRELEFPVSLSQYKTDIENGIKHILNENPSSSIAGSALRSLKYYREKTRNPDDLLAISQLYCERLFSAEVSLALREYHADITHGLGSAGLVAPIRCQPRPPVAPTPLYRRWWFWTLLGLGIATSATVVGLSIGATSQSIPAPYGNAPVVVF